MHSYSNAYSNPGGGIGRVGYSYGGCCRWQEPEWILGRRWGSLWPASPTTALALESQMESLLRQAADTKARSLSHIRLCLRIEQVARVEGACSSCLRHANIRTAMQNYPFLALKPRSWKWLENPGDMAWHRRISGCFYSRNLVLNTGSFGLQVYS